MHDERSVFNGLDYTPPPVPPTLKGDQIEAFKTATASLKNNNVLITGQAGSGKSFLTKAIRDSLPEVTVATATTGQAAQLIDGRTIHSFIGLIPRKGLVQSERIIERIFDCARLIVDEISMLSDVNFGNLMTRFEDMNHFPQIIFVGDFHQLPPVDTGEEHEAHRFAFKSPYWRNIKVLNLTQQHRQSDPDFISALNDIRVARITGNVISLLTSRQVAKFPDDCTMLFPLRRLVKDVNEQHILGLSGYITHLRGGFTLIDKKRESNIDMERFRYAKSLFLKPRARIVMLNNDKSERWVNGSTGIVTEVVEKPSKLCVKLDNGYEGPVEPVIENYYDGDGKVIASMQQYPIMLAKALTIHKSQGMTLDRVGVWMRDCFADGMHYTALSRARSRNGLFLIGDTNRFMVNQDVLKFYAENS